VSDFTEAAATQWGRVFPNLDLASYEIATRMVRGGRLIEKAIDEAALVHGLEVSGDYEVLATLRREQPDPLQPAVLSERMMITSSGMTGRLDRLQGEGLVERRPNPDDRRAIDVVVTEAGVHRADAIFESMVATFSEMIAPLDDAEAVELATLLRRLLEVLGDTHTAA
jgi:DNA-binding MarR family transcriptional regulator